MFKQVQMEIFILLNLRQLIDSAFTTEGKQVFTFVKGEGRWKELIGSKCIGATSQITFNAESGTFNILICGQANVIYLMLLMRDL